MTVETQSADAAPPDAAGGISYAIADQVLWRQLQEADSAEAFVRAWLALQCRFLDGAVGGVVVLGEPDIGPFAPAAFWPAEGTANPRLSAAAERAMAERQGVVVSHAEIGGGLRCIAQPLGMEGHLYGVAAVAVSGGRTPARDVLRQLQWGAAWIELLLRREQALSDAEQRERTGLAFDLLATVLEQPRLQAACTALVTELARRTGCDPVSIGFVRRRRCTVAAISHVADFARRMNLIRDIGAAMDEAVDQHAVVLYPPRQGWEYRVTRAHAELAGTHKSGAILTVPLQAQGKTIGAISLERLPGAEFDEATVDICDAVAGLVGPVLAEKRSNDRLIAVKLAEAFWGELKRFFGAHYFGRKLATAIAVLLAVFFSLASGPYSVTSPAVLEGRIQRTIVAPFNGYVAAEYARAGEIVKAGQLLVTLDDQDLSLERTRWTTARQQHLTEYDRALANRKLAEANISRAEVEQAEANLALVNEQLARTRIKAPFAGVVVSGDLSQSVGSAVERGQELFKIAPLNSYRVVLEIDEHDIADIEEGQRGTLRLAAIPEQPQSYRVERVTPVAEQREGRNFFRVEASLDDVADGLRPGMVGVAKTGVDERLLIRIWSERLVNWLRLALWRWAP